MSNYALRIPDSLLEYAKKCAQEDNVSMNQFFVMAIAEKVSALKTAEFFRKRADRADLDRFDEVMRKVRTQPPVSGDELPEGGEAPAAARRASRKRRTAAKKLRPGTVRRKQR